MVTQARHLTHHAVERVSITLQGSTTHARQATRLHLDLHTESVHPTRSGLVRLWSAQVSNLSWRNDTLNSCRVGPDIFGRM